MADIRLLRMARVLVHYSLGIKKGDRLSIRTEPVAAPLVREIVREALHAGAFPKQSLHFQASRRYASSKPPTSNCPTFRPGCAWRSKNMKQCFTFKQRKTRRS